MLSYHFLTACLFFVWCIMSKPYGDFFFNNCDLKTSHATYQDISSEDLAKEQQAFTWVFSERQQRKDINAETKRELQTQYKLTSSIAAEVELDFNLLERIQKDAAFATKSQELKDLIEIQYKKSAKLLLVNAEASHLRLEQLKYAKIVTPSSSINISTGKNKDKQKSAWEKDYENFRSLLEIYPASLLSFIGIINLYRLSYTFARISWKQFWLFMESLKVLINSNLNGVDINIAILDYPALAFYLFSVFGFITRILLDTISAFRHIFFPTIEEMGISTWERAKIEWHKRYPRLLNDGWWALANALTNFPRLFNIPIPVADWLLAAFLFFDVFLLSYILHHEKLKFAAKISWLDEQIKSLDKNTLIPEAQKAQYIEMFALMKKESSYMFTEAEATFGLYIGATLLFILSITLILTVSSPLMAPLGFFACVLAVAGILSGGNFGSYMGARKARQMGEQGNENIEILKARKEKEHTEMLSFSMALAEHIIMPIIITGLFTINWPSAVALIIIYIAVKNINFPQKTQVTAKDKNIIDSDDLSILTSR